MATKNPRIVGYVSPENHALLKKICGATGFDRIEGD